MDLNPLHALKSLGHDLVAAPKRVAEMVAHPTEALHELPGLAKDVFVSPLNPVSWAVKGAKAGLDLLPDQLVIAPKMPAYTKLDPAALAEAEKRSEGATHPMPCITGTTGSLNEPVSMVVSGTREQVLAAFEKAGWSLAEKGSLKTTLKKDAAELARLLHLGAIGLDYNPQGTEISPALLRGKPQDLAFNKNNDHHLVRDHIRLYDTGKTDANGKPMWEIATTRDIATTLDPRNGKQSHQIDPFVDRERDMTMADLLNAGAVKDWKVAKGVQTPEENANTDAKFQGEADGRIDGRVYMVDLA